MHDYRSIAKTKIFRFGVSLICRLYVKKEECIGKKPYYRKIKYITSNIDNFKVCLQLIITFLIIEYKSTKLTLNLHLLCMYIYHIILFNIYIIYIYIYKVLKEFENFSYNLCVFGFVTLSQQIHTLVTLVSHSHNLSQLLLKKPEQLSKSLFCSSWWSSQMFQT